MSEMIEIAKLSDDKILSFDFKNMIYECAGIRKSFEEFPMFAIACVEKYGYEVTNEEAYKRLEVLSNDKKGSIDHEKFNPF